MRRVNGTSREIHKEWLVRCHGLLSLDPLNRLIGHIICEVVILLVWRRHPSHTVIDQWIPLIGFAANEAVELVETLLCGPAIKGPRNTCFPGRRFMPFSKRACTLSIQPQHLGQRCNGIGEYTGVSGKCSRRFHNGTGVASAMVSTCLDTHPRRRAERRRVKVVVGQPVFCQSI